MGEPATSAPQRGFGMDVFHIPGDEGASYDTLLVLLECVDAEATVTNEVGTHGRGTEIP